MVQLAITSRASGRSVVCRVGVGDDGRIKLNPAQTERVRDELGELDDATFHAKGFEWVAQAVYQGGTMFLMPKDPANAAAIKPSPFPFYTAAPEVRRIRAQAREAGQSHSDGLLAEVWDALHQCDDGPGYRARLALARLEGCLHAGGRLPTRWRKAKAKR